MLIKKTGKTKFITGASQQIGKGKGKVSIHAEQSVAGQLKARGIKPSDVKKIYTEFEPCNKGQNCSKFLKQNFPNATVYWSYPYNNGMNEFSRVRKFSDLEGYGASFE
ncbi:MAG: nucleic acid/nucleotide deaminase domain-containing protein [Spirulinaceae cyanobacterium]